MFRAFNNIISLPLNQLNKVLQQMELEYIALALTSLSKEVLDNAIQNFSEEDKNKIITEMTSLLGKVDLLKIAEAQQYALDVADELDNMGALTSDDHTVEKMSQKEINEFVLNYFSEKEVPTKVEKGFFNTFIDIIKSSNEDVTNIFKNFNAEEIAMALIYCTNAKRMDLIRSLPTDLQLKILEHTDNIGSEFFEEDARNIHESILNFTNELINNGTVVIEDPKQQESVENIDEIFGF